MMEFARNQKGFTLIELMIVVAVLGIVSAIAIPNFMRYQAKSRQTEAKTNLGGIFVAETTYYGENSYFGNFGQIGFAVAAATNRYTYRTGAAGPAGGASTGTAGNDLINPGGGLLATRENEVVPAMNSTPGNPPGFTATATANLDSDPTCDYWHVNDIKQNLQNPDADDLAG